MNVFMTSQSGLRQMWTDLPKIKATGTRVRRKHPRRPGREYHRRRGRRSRFDQLIKWKVHERFCACGQAGASSHRVVLHDDRPRLMVMGCSQIGVGSWQQRMSRGWAASAAQLTRRRGTGLELHRSSKPDNPVAWVCTEEASWRQKAGNCPEVARGILAAREAHPCAPWASGVRVGEVGCVSKAEGIGSYFQREPLRHSEIAEHAEVHVEVSRAAELVATGVAKVRRHGSRST